MQGQHASFMLDAADCQPCSMGGAAVFKIGRPEAGTFMPTAQASRAQSGSSSGSTNISVLSMPPEPDWMDSATEDALFDDLQGPL